MSDPRRPGIAPVRGLGIGAQKAGTTTLWQILIRQPWFDAPSMKELKYFSTRSHLGEAWYRAQFPTASPGRVTAEISPSYLRTPIAAERAHRFDPTQRVFAILRDPVERALSGFNMLRRKGVVDPSTTLLDVLRLPATDATRAELLKPGEYATQLGPWIDLFGRDSVHVLFLEELVRDPDPVCHALFKHLGVDDAAIVPVTRETLPHANAARDVRSPTAKRFLRRMAMRAADRGHARTSVAIARAATLLDKDPKGFTRPAMSDEERAVLRDHYEEELKRLKSLLGRPMPW